MKKIFKKFCCLCAAALLFNANTQIPAQAADKSSTNPSSAFGYMDYNGYLDECSWSGSKAFKNCDYDGDGRTDRVFRKEKAGNTTTCTYRIEFGNGKRLLMKNADWTGTPVIQAGDTDNDGENEILFTQTYPMSTDPQGSGNMRLYDKKGGTYKLVKLPLSDSGSHSDQPGLTLTYQIDQDHTYWLTVAETGYKSPFSFTRAYLEETGLTTYYDVFCDGEKFETPVYDAKLRQNGKRTDILCRVSLLGKFCADEIRFRIVFTDQGYAIKNMKYVPIH